MEKSGKSYTVKGDVGLSGLSPECRLYMELSEEVMHYCYCGYMLHLTFMHFDRCSFKAFMFSLGLLDVWSYCLLLL